MAKAVKAQRAQGRRTGAPAVVAGDGTPAGVATQRAWYRVAMTGPEGEVFVILLPLVGDPSVGLRFDPNAPSPALVRLTYERYVYCGELEVDASEMPVEARVLWHNDEDEVSDLDMFAAPLRVGRSVLGTGIRYSDDELRFVVREIVRLG